MTYSKITKKDFSDWLKMGLTLWPDWSRTELKKEFIKIMADPRQISFIAKNEVNQTIGFINISFRYDHVAGSTKKPVLYIEGLYVVPTYRNQGVAKNLIKQAEQFGKKHGCKEIASDALLENVVSQKFHQKLGFRKVNITVNFIKKIKTN